MKINLSSNRQIINIWLSTYIVILIVPLVMNYYLFIHTKEIISEELMNSRRAVASSLRNNIDEELYALKQVGVLMGQDPKTLRLISDDKKKLMNKRKYSVIEYRDYIDIMNGSHGERHILLRLGASGDILMDRVYSSGEEFYQYYINEDYFPTYESWQEILNKKYKNDYFTMNLNSSMEVNKNYFVYGASLPFGNLKASGATLFVMLEQEKIMDILNQHRLAEGGAVFILDQSL